MFSAGTVAAQYGNYKHIHRLRQMAHECEGISGFF